MASGGRSPQNLQGLMKFCVEVTQREDTTKDSSALEMSPEDRQFLENVFRELQNNDPIKVMIEDIKVILDESDSANDKTRKEAALEDLVDHVQDLDLANDFFKIGGQTMLEMLLTHEHAGFRWRTADLVGILAENNPTTQQLLLDTNIIPTLVHIIKSDDDRESRIKAFYAISCLCREFPPAQQEFLYKCDGFSVLVQAMTSDVEKLQIKAAFLLASLCTGNPKYTATLLSIGVLDQLVGLLQQSHAAYHEHLMRALLVLVEENEDAQSECRRPELRLSDLLAQRLVVLQDKEEFQEELEYTRKLQQICFHFKNKNIDR